MLSIGKLRWDDTHLYVGAYMEEPQVWATLTHHDSVIFNDNDFEVREQQDSRLREQKAEQGQRLHADIRLRDELSSVASTSNVVADTDQKNK